MTKENWKQALISILIGAGVAFFTTLFDQIGSLLKTHATEIASGGASGVAYFIRSLRQS